MEAPIAFVSRKNARKQKKLIKKLQKVAFATHRKVENVIAENLQGKSKKEKLKRKNETTSDVEKDVPKKKAQPVIDHSWRDEADDTGLTYEQYLKDIKKMNSQKMIGSIQDKEDERAIHTYARLLGMQNKTKVPKAFDNDGLDTLLEFCDAEDRSALDGGIYNASLLNDEDEADEKKKKSGSSKKNLKSKKVVSQDEDELSDEQDDEEDEEEEDDLLGDLENPDDDGSDEEDEEPFDLLGADSDSTECSDEEEDGEDEEEEEEEDEEPSTVKKGAKKMAAKNSAKEQETVEEDIYGRKVNKAGHLIDFDPQAAQRKLEELESKMPLEQRQKLEKTIISIINKISDLNLLKSRQTIDELWRTSSKNEVKKVLANTIFKMISAPYRLPDVMLISYGMFLHLLHNTVSSEISAHITEFLVCDYVNHIQKPKVLDDKSLDNKTVLISFLIHFKIVKPEFMLEIIEKLSGNLTEENLHLIVLFATYCYIIAKKSFIGLFFQKLENANELFKSSPLAESTRAQFISEQIAKLKKSGPTNIDTSLIENQNKFLHGVMRQQKFEVVAPLAMTVNDLMNAEESGRWWIVGSAFRLAEGAQSSTGQTKEFTNFPEHILLAASRARMSTSIRKTIFCTISCSTGLEEAFAALMNLKLKGLQEREVIHVIVYMMLAEKTYNVFYTSLLGKILEGSKRYPVTLKFCIWDKIKDIKSLNARKKTNLTEFITDIIRNEILQVTVLKVVDWITMSADVAKVVKQVITSLEQCSQSKLIRILVPITHNEKNSDFADGFRIFLQQLSAKGSSFPKFTRILESAPC